MEKSHLCMRPWSLLTILNFSAWGPTDTTVFNVFFPSSRRDDNEISIFAQENPVVARNNGIFSFLQIYLNILLYGTKVE